MLNKMRSTLKVSKCTPKGVLAIICSNFFSHYTADQKKTVAISQMFNHVQLHVHWMHLLNNRICKYTYITPTVQILLTVAKTGVQLKLFNLENGLYCVQSGVFLTKFGHKLPLSISA